MNLIACADKNWGIGYKGELLFHIPADMKRFRELTINKTVVMGRRTLDSLPGTKPLKDRLNIVLTRDKNFKRGDVVIFNSIKDFLEEYAASPDVFVIGGSEIYSQLKPYCDLAYITRIYAVKPADKYIENLDEADNFKLITRSPKYEYNGIEYTFDLYQNTALKAP